MSDSSFYSNTGTTSASISSINTLSNAATASKDAAAASAVASAASATTASGHKDTATTQAALATTNGAAQVALATTQATNAATSASTASGHKDTATTQAALATTNGAAQVTLATAQVALATTQAGLATTNGAAQVALATTQAGLATTNGAAQVALATTQAGNSASSATESAGSATTASGHKDTAATQAGLATTNGAAQVTLAAAQVALATTQAGNSATSASAAAASAVSAAASLDLFTDQYLGAHSSNPTVDGDGDALTVGDLYYDSTAGNMKYYNGSAWVSAFVSASGMAALSGSTFTGNVTVPGLVLVGSGTVDGRDVSVDGTKLDGIATSANNYVHPNHSGEVTSTADGAMVIADNIVDEANLKVSNSPTNGYVLTAQSGNTGGLTWAADTDTTYSVGDGGLTQNNFTNTLKTKLDGIEGSSDVTDATNVTAAGALMDSEVTNLAQVKAFASSDYATAAQGTLAAAALPKSGGAMTGAITTNSTFDGVDIATRDAVLTSTTTIANAALPKSGGAMTGAITTNSTFDGVDIASRDAVLTSTTTTANAALPKSGGTMTGVLTADAGIDIDNFNIDGTTIALSSGDMTLDAAGDINLDADGADIILKDGGTSFGELDKDGNNFRIKNPISDGDVLIQGNDGGSIITALTLDMSAAGAATFNNDVTAFSDERLKSNITTIPDALSKVSEMRGVHYVRDATGKDSSGVIAQEMQKVAPELVLTADDEMGTLSVNYGNITGYLIEAIKELKAEIQELKAR